MRGELGCRRHSRRGRREGKLPKNEQFTKSRREPSLLQREGKKKMPSAMGRSYTIVGGEQEVESVKEGK